MKKRNSLIFVIGLFVCVLSILAEDSYAQKTDAVKSDETQKPAKKSVLQDYIDISSLPREERSRAFSYLPAEEKSNVFRFHLAYQIINGPNSMPNNGS